MSDKSKTAGIIALAAVFFIADRAFKLLAVNIRDHGGFRIIGDWLSFRLSINQGIAFSLPLKSDLIVMLTCLAFLALVYFAWLSRRDRRWIAFAALSFVIAGAYSNLLDRLARQGVIDYLSLAHWSAFNLADAMITVGIAAVILSAVKSGRPVKKSI